MESIKKDFLWIQNLSTLLKCILGASLVIVFMSFFKMVTKTICTIQQFLIHRHSPLVFLSTLVCDLEEFLTWYVYWRLDKDDEKRRQEQEQLSIDNLSDREKLNKEIYKPTLKLFVGPPNSEQLIPVTVRALLDTGASLSSISPRLVDRLQLTKKLNWPKLIYCFPGTRSTFQYQSVKVQLKPIDGDIENVESVEIAVDRKKPSMVGPPSKTLFNLVQTQFGIKLTDDDCTDKWYDLLIGQDLLNSHIFMREQKSLFLTDELAVIETRFGHVVQGRFDSEKPWTTDQLPQMERAVKEQSNFIQDHKESNKISKKITIEVENPLWLSILVLQPFSISLIGLILLSIPILVLLLTVSKLQSLFQCSKYSQNSLLPTKVEITPRTTPSKIVCYGLFEILKMIKMAIEEIQLVFKKQYTSDEITFNYMPSLVVNVSNVDSDGTHAPEKIYVDFDSGSKFSFISSTLAKKLNCKPIPIEPYSLRSGPPVRIELTEAVRVRFQSVHDLNVVEEVQLLLHPDPNLGRVIKPSPIITQLAASQFGIVLPQLSEYESHILLGTDILTSKFLLPQQNSVHLLPNLRLVPSKFGWTLNGSQSRDTYCECFNFWAPNE